MCMCVYLAGGNGDGDFVVFASYHTIHACKSYLPFTLTSTLTNNNKNFLLLLFAFQLQTETCTIFHILYINTQKQEMRIQRQTVSLNCIFKRKKIFFSFLSIQCCLDRFYSFLEYSGFLHFRIFVQSEGYFLCSKDFPIQRCFFIIFDVMDFPNLFSWQYKPKTQPIVFYSKYHLFLFGKM